MNKGELISEVQNRTGLSTTQATRVVDALFDSISAALERGEEVRLVGFGTFSVRRRAASSGRNPRTGERIRIQASRQPVFKMGTQLRDAVSGRIGDDDVDERAEGTSGNGDTDDPGPGVRR